MSDGLPTTVRQRSPVRPYRSLRPGLVQVFIQPHHDDSAAMADYTGSAAVENRQQYEPGVHLDAWRQILCVPGDRGYAAASPTAPQ